MTSTRAASHSGFSLIELVSVMLLLGILAVIALPRFTDSTDFSTYTAQDQIIAGARMAQQYAMYDRSSGACYGLIITVNTLAVKQWLGGVEADIGPSEEWRSGITIDSGVPISSATVYFDGLGNVINITDPAVNCIGSQKTTLTTITIGSPATLNVCINPVGYIYAC